MSVVADRIAGIRDLLADRFGFFEGDDAREPFQLGVSLAGMVVMLLEAEPDISDLDLIERIVRSVVPEFAGLGTPQ
jgi:hypothetical protein